MKNSFLSIFIIVISFSIASADEEVSRSYFPEDQEKGPVIKVTQRQTKVKSQIKDGDNICKGEFFKDFPEQPLYFNFPKRKKEVQLQLNQFIGKSKKGLACQVNGNVNCRKLIYRGDHLECILAYFSPGKGNILSVKLNFDGEIKFDENILNSQKLESKELCKTFLRSPQVYKKELSKLKQTPGMNYFHLVGTNQNTNEIYYIYMGCGARIRSSKSGKCEVAITDMGRPVKTEKDCENAYLSKEGVTCQKDGKDILLQYQFCLGGHIAVQNYNQDAKNPAHLYSSLRDVPLSLQGKSSTSATEVKPKE